MKNHQQILLIAYHFPPSIAVGGHRAAGFARHLADFGWPPHVLTIRECLIEKKDPETLAGFNNVPIYRTGTIPDVSDAYLKLKVMYHSVKDRRKVSRNELNEIFALSHSTGSTTSNKRTKFKDYILSLLVTMPDKERNWVIPAAVRAAQLIKKNRFCCILTSSPPYSVHVIGYIIKILFNVGWVADFRDPWMTPLGKKLYPTTSLSIAIESKIEKKFIETADLVICNTEALKTEMVKKYKRLPERKFVYLPNGFDEAAFKIRSKKEKYEKFTICYTGTLYLGRSPEPIFKALREIDEAGEYDIGKIQLLLIGYCSLMNGQRTADLISSYNLTSVVKVIGPIPHGEALTIICRSHLALLLAPDQPFQVPGKIFEYIGAGTKILAITGRGATADLINKNGFGKVFEPNNVEEIKRFILKSITEFSAINVHTDNCSVEKYNRKYLVEQLAEHLNSII